MAYRYGNRYQKALLPKSIEGYVGADDPVRVYDAFVEAVDVEKLDIQIDPRKVGNAEHDHKAMLKLSTKCSIITNRQKEFCFLNQKTKELSNYLW